jgi:chromosome segregation ATPase
VRKLIVGGVLLIAMCAVTAAFGQATRSGGGTANSQIMQQYQELSAERVTLKAENERLKKEADDAKAQLATLKKELDGVKARAGGSAAELDKARGASAASEQALIDNRRKLEELVARFKETALTLRTVETDRARLDQELSDRSSKFDTCAVNNVGLYDLNNEILKRWEHEGFFSRLARADGFTRLARTHLENMVDNYRSRATELKLRPTTPAGATPPAAPPATPHSRP